MTCVLLQFIRNERVSAELRQERAEVARRLEEERKHLERCDCCALYLELWPSAKIGTDQS